MEPQDSHTQNRRAGHPDPGESVGRRGGAGFEDFVGVAAGEGGHDFDVEVVLGMDPATLFQEGDVAVEGAAIIADFAAFESAADFGDAAFDGVLRGKADAIADFLKRNAIVAAVGIFDVFDLGERYLRADFFGDFSEGKIQAVIADVEDFSTDGFDGSRQRLDDGFGNILHMDKGAPLAAVEDGDHAILNGLGGEEIDDEIEARTGREAENGGEAKNGGVEVA